MKRFKNILVVARETEATLPVLERAAELALRNGARLTLLGTTEPVSARRSIVDGPDGSAIDLNDVIASARRDMLNAMAIPFPGIEIEVVSRREPAFASIIRRVLSHGHDLVMVPPDRHMRRGVRGSSTAMHLLRKCPVPVWVHAADQPSPDVAVTVGPFDTDEERSSLDITLLEMAASLAASRGGRLHIVHAWRLVGETLFRAAGRGPSPDQVDGLVLEAHLQAQADLDRLLSGALAVEVETEVHLIQGAAGDVIPEFVERVRPGVLVMGTLARTGIQGVLIGNTAERVLASIDTSVLAVKPDGFVSPIEATVAVVDAAGGDR
jgi:nucleotide-binding universal stress UspA family protein